MNSPQYWREIVLIFAIFQGVVLLFAFFIFSSKSKVNKDKIYGLLTFSLIILLINELSITSNLPLPIEQLVVSMAESVPLLFGPLLYNCIKSLLFKNAISWKWYHYNPAVLLFNINLLNQIFEFEIWSMFGGTLFIIVRTVIFIQILTYLYFTIRLALLFKSERQINWLFVPPYYYFIAVLVLVSLNFLLFVMSLLAALNGLVRVPVDYSEVWIVVSILTFLLLFFIRSDPDFFKEKQRINSSKNN